MSFTILLLSPDTDPSWPEKIMQAVPGAIAKAFADPKDALAEIETADAAYGTVPPELFVRAKNLRWICAARAGLGGAWFTRRWSRAMSSSPACGAATTSIWPLTRSPFCSPSPVDSSITCRRGVGSEVPR